MNATVRVLVVEDSPVARELLIHILEGDPQIQIIGTASDGVQALALVERLRPDLVTMDVIMPGMGGLEATRRIMEKFPLPIIIVSGTINRGEISTTFEALKAGAVTAIPRPAGPGSPDYAAAARELLRTVRAMAEVRVVRRWSQERAGKTPPLPRSASLAASPRLVAIGASTGGPEALQRILEGLPADFPLPILIVQHMAAGFLGGLAEWLNRSSSLPVALARDGEKVLAGRVLIAPDDRHMGISRDGRILLSADSPEKGVRPSVAHLFRSVRQAFSGRAIAVLLSGMGRDGALELKELRDAGAATVAQNFESSIIYGMPGEAVRLGAAIYQLAPTEIPRLLVKLAASGEQQPQAR
jgi:two-component system, chemotaxis family, protein-glutamate methylesterase/glutaminase